MLQFFKRSRDRLEYTGSDEVTTALPEAQGFGFENEVAAFEMQFAHGLDSGEQPMFSRV